MDILLRELAENAGVKSILKKESVLGGIFHGKRVYEEN